MRQTYLIINFSDLRYEHIYYLEQKTLRSSYVLKKGLHLLIEPLNVSWLETSFL